MLRETPSTLRSAATGRRRAAHVLGGVLAAGLLASCGPGMTSVGSFTESLAVPGAQFAQGGAPSPFVAPDAAALPETTIVAVRYPQRAAPNATGVIDLAYRRRGLANRFYNLPDEAEALSWNISSFPGQQEMSGPAARMAFVRTNYMAMSIYRALADKYGAERVRLQPYEIDIARFPTGLYGGAAGGVGGEIARQAELVEREAFSAPPALVTVDLFAFVDPFYTIGSAYFQYGRSHPSSFGKTFSPLISIHTHPDNAPATLGAIGVSADLLPYAHNQGVLRDGYSATIVDYLNGLKGVPVSRSGEAARLDPDGGLVVYPQVEFTVDESTLRAEAFQTGPSNLLKKLEDDVIAQVGRSLGQIDVGSARQRSLAAYAARFDRALAQRIASGGLSDGDAKRVDALGQFEQAERTFLAKVDDALIAKTLLSDWGQLARETMQSEEDFATRYIAAREAQQQQQMMASLSFAMSNMSTIAAGGTQTPLGAMQNSLRALEFTIGAAAESERFGEALASDFRAFNRSIAAETLEPIEFVFELFGERITLTAGNLEELQMKMRAVYVTRLK